MYVDKLTGNIVSVGWAKREYNLSGAKYPLLPGVMEYCNLAEYTKATIDPDTEVPLQTATESGGVWTQDKRVKTDAEKSAVEQSWAAGELDRADKMIFQFEDNHGRPPAGNMAQWRAYRNALRDHVINDVVQGVRPDAPDA